MTTAPGTDPAVPGTRQTPAFRAARAAFIASLAPHAQRLGILSAGGQYDDGWHLEVRALNPERLDSLPRVFRGIRVSVVPGRLVTGR